MPREIRDDKPLPRMCAKCREPLTPIGPKPWHTDLQDPESYSWHHGSRYSDEDHDPEPIPLVDESDARLLCDFCGVHHPTWDFPAKTFVDTISGFQMGAGIEGFDSGGDWTACDECAQLILSDNYKALAKRGLRQFRDLGREQKSVMYAKLSTLHRQFRDNRTGPPTPIGTTHWIAAELSSILQLEDPQ